MRRICQTPEYVGYSEFDEAVTLKVASRDSGVYQAEIKDEARRPSAESGR